MRKISKNPAAAGDALHEALRLDKLRRFDEAADLCRQVIGRQPRHALAHHLLGVIAHHAGDMQNAVKHISRAIKLDPALPDTRINLAKVYRDLMDWENYRRYLQAAMPTHPNKAAVMADIAMCHEKLNRPEDAVAGYQQALAADPAMLDARTGLGAALLRLGRTSEAEAQLEQVIAANPSQPNALINLAILRDMQGRRDDALAAIEKAAAANPENAEVRYHFALALLTRGQLTRGWDEYAWRLRRPDSQTLHHMFSHPVWSGEDLAGKTILVWTEQGIGDQILLSTMIPDLAARAGKCIVTCAERLIPLFSRSFPEIEALPIDLLLKKIADGIQIDFQASLSHLGRQLRPSFSAFPTRRSHLRADAGKTTKLRAAYQDGNESKLLVGLSWRSSNVAASGYKSMTLTEMAPLLKVPNVRWVSLQYGDAKDDITSVRNALDVGIHRDPSINPMRDMDAFAAQVAAMDRVISVSNTTVHVAGALGVPVWTFVPASYGRLWYWFLDRADSPWYPSMSLYRQRPGENWDSAVMAAARDLEREARP